MSKAAILLAYCVPFAFLGVYGDAALGTPFPYAASLAAMAALCWAAAGAGGAPVAVAGNALSLASSVAFAAALGLDPMGWYFKPLTSHSLIAVVSAASAACQAAAFLARRHRTR